MRTAALRARSGGRSGPRAFVVQILAGVSFPVVATGIASIPLFKSPASATNAAMLYLLSVVAAAVVGGLPGGLIASFLSFLGLNFFFTPPLRNFAVAKGEDLLALFAFLIVSVLVATLLTNALAERTRAEQGEDEARLLYRISSRLLGGTPLPTALKQFANDMVELFSLAGAEVSTLGLGALDLTASAGAAPSSGGPGTVVPLRTERGTFGQVTIYPRPGGRFEERQLELAAAFAGQLALAVEAAILAEKTRRSQAQAESNRVRAALFSSVTHDLRTPLAAIKAGATSLLDADVVFDDAQRRDLLTTIAEESDRLNRLISNLLSLSRLRAGALVQEKTAAPVEDVIEAAVARLRKRGGTIVVDDNADLPLVPMDLLQIDQVVSNLLENALRFTADGVPVEISAKATDGSVEVAVADHGPGIRPEDRERVFQEFFRGDAAGDGGGVGLGLAIARAIVEAHGGTMWVAETPGGGATVGFRLPVGPNGEGGTA
jgi:two-component system, OmpR family, sensor histidine kinase KdpD